MSNWNESPDWNLLSTINSGKEFSAADGLLASDVVRIVENVVYVYNQQNGLQGVVSNIDNRLYAVQANIGSLSELTTENKSSIVASINEVNEKQTATRNSLADLKEALYGYVLDTTEIETESAIPYTVEISGTTYNLVDDVRGLVKEIKGGTVKSKNLFDINSAVKVSGFSSFSKNGNQITVSQSNTGQWSSANVLLDTSIAGKTITITTNAKTDGINNTYIRIQWLASDGLAGGSRIESNFISGQSYQKITVSGVCPTQPSEKFKYLCLMLYSNASATLESGVSYSSTFKDIMINLGDTALPYEPYFDGLKSVEYTGLEVKGKNLLNPKTLSPWSGALGFTIELIGDNTVHIYGTSNNTSSYAGMNIVNTNDTTLYNKGYKIQAFDYQGINPPKLNIIYGLREIDTSGQIAISVNITKGVYYDFSFKIMVSKQTSTEYKPYREPVNILPFTTTLRGVGDVKDKILITKNENDDYYTATKITNIGEIDLGTLEYTFDSGNGTFYSNGLTLLKNINAATIPNIICPKYDVTSINSLINSSKNSISYYTYNNYDYIYIRDASYTDVTTLKTAMAGVMLAFELETPTTEVLSTTLTESDVMPLLELGGSVEIVNENSLYVTGSTALEMVYKLINNTTTTSEVTE